MKPVKMISCIFLMMMIITGCQKNDVRLKTPLLIENDVYTFTYSSDACEYSGKLYLQNAGAVFLYESPESMKDTKISLNTSKCMTQTQDISFQLSITDLPRDSAICAVSQILLAVRNQNEEELKFKSDGDNVYSLDTLYNAFKAKILFNEQAQLLSIQVPDIHVQMTFSYCEGTK